MKRFFNVNLLLIYFLSSCGAQLIRFKGIGRAIKELSFRRVKRMLTQFS